MTISEIKDGESVHGQFLVSDCKKGVTAKGGAYLTIVLQDYSGTIEGKKWTLGPDDMEIFAKGTIVQVGGVANLYRDVMQLKIESGEPVAMDNIEWARFVQHAPVGKEVLKKKLAMYVNSFSDPDVKALVVGMLKRYEDKYFDWPAAAKNHHDYVSGLLYHSLTMADLASKVCQVYPALNRDIVIGGTLIHDIGKCVELSGPNATTYTIEGKLLGHISIGQAELRDVAKDLGMYDFDALPEEQKNPTHPLWHKKEIAIVFEHIILSHHGIPEYGSAVRPLTREAQAVSMIDDMDAKMMILEKAYAGVECGGFTSKLFTMDDRYFYKPFYTEDATRPSGTSLEEEKADLEK